jgi:hypothetical protein
VDRSLDRKCEGKTNFLIHIWGALFRSRPARFQPAEGVEFDLVEPMIAASWRGKRVANMEAALVELQIDRMRPDIEEEFIEIDNPACQSGWCGPTKRGLSIRPAVRRTMS